MVLRTSDLSPIGVVMSWHQRYGRGGAQPRAARNRTQIPGPLRDAGTIRLMIIVSRKGAVGYFVALPVLAYSPSAVWMWSTRRLSETASTSAR